MLTGKKAIVTGAASGIGAAIMAAYRAAGAVVIGVDLPSPGWKASDALEDGIGRVAIDVTMPGAPAEIVAAAVRMAGGIDILVNNAGIAPGGNAETTSDEQWDRVIAVNLTAVFRLTREAIPHLKRSGRGRVINMGSIMSDIAGPETLTYVTSKHAVAGLTKAMAIDLGQYGIAANYLQPGSIVTPLAQAHMHDPHFVEYWHRKTPLGRLGQPGDIASVALFLASEGADYISGAGLRIDGGAAINI